MYSYGRYEVNTKNAITLRLDLILKVSHNAIEIEIRCLTLSFNEPSKLYLVLSFYHKGIFRCALERKGGCLFIEPISLADEDEIHFRFQSKLKKLCISLVCSNKLANDSFNYFKQFHYSTSILERRGVRCQYRQRRGLSDVCKG